MTSIHETSPGDRGVWFDIAREHPCQSCNTPIREGEQAIYTDDGLLYGYECGCGDPEAADDPSEHRY